MLVFAFHLKLESILKFNFKFQFQLFSGFIFDLIFDFKWQIQLQFNSRKSIAILLLILDLNFNCIGIIRGASKMKFRKPRLEGTKVRGTHAPINGMYFYTHS